MKTIALAAASLAAVLAVGTAVAAEDRPSNRGYVVGDAGVARLANDAGTQAGVTAADQAVSSETQAQRPVIKTGNGRPVAEPIGVNEPGVNRAASRDGEGVSVPVLRGSARAYDAKGSEPDSSNAVVSSQRGIDKKDIHRSTATGPDAEP